MRDCAHRAERKIGFVFVAPAGFGRAPQETRRITHTGVAAGFRRSRKCERGRCGIRETGACCPKASGLWRWEEDDIVKVLKLILYQLTPFLDFVQRKHTKKRTGAS